MYAERHLQSGTDVADGVNVLRTVSAGCSGSAPSLFSRDTWRSSDATRSGGAAGHVRGEVPICEITRRRSSEPPIVAQRQGYATYWRKPRS